MLIHAIGADCGELQDAVLGILVLLAGAASLDKCTENKGLTSNHWIPYE
jgi:hypothetical protein